ncbi:dihydrolipoyl dehydrogenase [Salinispirillum marinum]|uniref:Dihydrolipoyl dehydrogenase n=2 Tax=Saccharospirillaceae TaxID=255527 RepID=A0ABV8BE88_9GAMM
MDKNSVVETDVLVLGAGPGGYSAAFRAADLGVKVTLVERYAELGGVCLNVGCIPSKALLHVAATLHEAEESAQMGVRFARPELDIDRILAFKDGTVKKLTDGIRRMTRQRKVDVEQGTGTFTGPNQLLVTRDDETETQIQFKHAIIAAGSRPVKLPFLPDDDRIFDSTGALALRDVPPRLAILGGGIIGLEMATVYQALGSEVTIIEAASQLVPAADADLVRVYQRYNRDRFTIELKTRVTGVKAEPDALILTVEAADGTCREIAADALLVAVGRRPNGDLTAATRAGVVVDDRGFIPVDAQQRTNVPHIYAIGDIVGDPMLAHKATHQGHVAAEVIAGHNRRFEPLAIPSIAYTNPEIAWTGLTEQQAKAQGIAYAVAVFPWSVSGRALGAGRGEGKTKLIYDPETDRLLGAGLVGIHAGELLGELTLALEFGASVEDLGLTIHAHPTLHETVGLAGELAAGTVTDVLNPKARKIR